MIRVETFLCILVAVVVMASEGFDAQVSIQAGRASDFQDTVGESLSRNTVYEKVSVSYTHLYLSVVSELRKSATSLEDCRSQATIIGGHAFWYAKSECWIIWLQFPMCTIPGGKENMYIQPKYLTTGTSNDGTTVEPLKKGALFGKVLSDTNAEYGSFRVDSHTLTSFYQISGVSSESQTIFFEYSGQKRYVNADIVVSPACYSNSACGTTFIYPIPKVKRTIKVFSDYCNKEITVSKGEEVYLLSHDKFGCTLFPDNGYGGSKCKVYYRGNDGPLKITIIYSNFVGSDACDGFTLGATAFYNEDERNFYQLCRNPVTEIMAQNPKGRLELKGISATQRSKIGFIFKLSYA